MVIPFNILKYSLYIFGASNVFCSTTVDYSCSHSPIQLATYYPSPASTRGRAKTQGDQPSHFLFFLLSNTVHTYQDKEETP